MSKQTAFCNTCQRDRECLASPKGYRCVKCQRLNWQLNALPLRWNHKPILPEIRQQQRGTR